MRGDAGGLNRVPPLPHPRLRRPLSLRRGASRSERGEVVKGNTGIDYCHPEDPTVTELGDKGGKPGRRFAHGSVPLNGFGLRVLLKFEQKEREIQGVNKKFARWMGKGARIRMMISGQRSAVSGQLSVVRCPWSVGLTAKPARSAEPRPERDEGCSRRSLRPTPCGPNPAIGGGWDTKNAKIYRDESRSSPRPLRALR